MSKIFYIMGKSSSGKDTLFKRLAADQKLSLKMLIGYTTRPRRQGEREGHEYHYVTENTMKELEQQGKIIERRSYSTIHGMWYYFTVNDDQVDLENYNYIVIGTLESYCKMRDYFGESHLEPIYIEVEDGVRLERALKRERMQEHPKYAELCRRFLADEEDFSEANLIKCGIKKRYDSTDLEKTINMIYDCFNKNYL